MGKESSRKDLAKKLGVSCTLVSLVLNNKGDQYGIKRETQEKVLFMAQKLGMFNNEKDAADTMPIETQPGIVGMVVSSFNDAFVCNMTPYLQEVFSKIGIGLSVISKDTDDDRYERMIRAFCKFYSGLILVGEAADDKTVRSLRTADYPFVVLNKSISSSRINTINSDTDLGSSLAVNHIVKLGYKNILIASSSKTDKRDLASLLTEFAKIPDLNKPLVIELQSSINGKGFDCSQFEQFLRPPYRTDIIITMDSDLVFSIMPFIYSLKMRIPRDIALFSMSEGASFDLIMPPVSCLKKPYITFASKTANILWTEIKNSGKSKHVQQISLAPELIVRSSCGSFE